MSPAAQEVSDAVARLWQEASDLRERSRPSGLFYLIGWILVAALADVWTRAPLAAWTMTLVLVVLAIVRLRLAAPPSGDVLALEAYIRRVWGLIYANIVSWSAIATSVWLTKVHADARTVALICTVMYGSAFGYAYCMRRPQAIGGLLIVVGPLILAVLVAGNVLIAFALLVYLTHLLLVTGSGVANYRQRLDLDSELRRQRNAYERQSRIDALTGLHNRGHFNARLRELCDGAEPFGLLVLDLDHFKAINDAHGHGTGDDCLVRFASILRASCDGPAPFHARLGGEEFAVLLPGVDGDTVERIAEHVRRTVASSPGVAMTVSIGALARSAGACSDPDQLYRAADAALYAAKAKGRNRVESAPAGSG
jgi:diguanylate cyclase (GGDEF)-like protein